MNCPVCDVPLIAVERDQIEVDSCISCRGLWFDRGELELLCEKQKIVLEFPKIFAAAETSERKRRCPRCRKEMAKVALAKNQRLITDHCPDEHGVWFDPRELGAIVDYAASAQGTAGPVARFLGEVFGKQ
jgi:Zn-finger nucleic acid-binding protein